MTTEYEVYTHCDGDTPSCDRCGFEDGMLETAQGHVTVETSDGGYALERLCRYCYETELGNGTEMTTTAHITPKQMTRGIVHAMNALELRLRLEMQSLIVGLTRALTDDANEVKEKRTAYEDRRKRNVLSGGKHTGADRRTNQRRG